MMPWWFWVLVVLTPGVVIGGGMALWILVVEPWLVRRSARREIWRSDED